jgi:hypothetical protein
MVNTQTCTSWLKGVKTQIGDKIERKKKVKAQSIKHKK